MRDTHKIYEITHKSKDDRFRVGQKIMDTFFITDIVERIEDYDVKGYATVRIYISEDRNDKHSKPWKEYASIDCIKTFDRNY